MSGTSYHYISGIAKWARVFTLDKEYDNTHITLYPDKEGWEEYGKLELQLVVKEDDDGRFVKFRRPNSKLIKGELVEFGLPKVVDKDNKEFKELIGNGSRVTVKISVYDSKKGTGHRLEAVRVEELVPYKGTGETTEEDTGTSFFGF